jgi:AcrR family transcriptional regulator
MLGMLGTSKRSSRENILAATLDLMDSSEGADAVTMRRVAATVGITPMAIYKHFKNREDLLVAVATAEYRRIASYFEQANARKDIKGLRGMLGYLDYALDHPQLFRFMFSGSRPEAFVFPGDAKSDKSPTFTALQVLVARLMEQGIFKRSDVAETALSIWAYAHGLIALQLSGRIKLPRVAFRKLYMRSLDRLLLGLATRE